MKNNPIDKLRSEVFCELEYKDLTIMDSMQKQYMDLYIKVQEELYGNVMLKGNALLNGILPYDARMTKDLDFSVDTQESYEKVKEVLREFGEDLISKGMASSYSILEIEDRRSGGINIYDDKDHVILSVDVSLAKGVNQFSTKYSYNGVEVIGSSINKIVADKMLATLSNKRFRRMKDLYDLYIIYHSKLTYKVDYREVTKFMVDYKGEEEFNSLINNIPFSEEILLELNKAWGKLIVTNVYDKVELVKPDLGDVLYFIYDMCDEIKECI